MIIDSGLISYLGLGLRPVNKHPHSVIRGDPTGVVANAAAETWNWMPPLQNVEVRKNFNKLKSGFDAMHFMSRDTVVVR